MRTLSLVRHNKLAASQQRMRSKHMIEPNNVHEDEWSIVSKGSKMVSILLGMPFYLVTMKERDTKQAMQKNLNRFVF